MLISCKQTHMSKRDADICHFGFWWQKTTKVLHHSILLIVLFSFFFLLTIYDSHEKSYPTLALFRKHQLKQTTFGGTVKGEFAMQNTSDVGSLVEFTFNVSHFQNCIFNLCLCATHPHFPHPHPVFEPKNV